MNVTLTVTDIVSGIQVPDSVRKLESGEEMTFTAVDESKALPLARKIARELLKFRVTSFTGSKSGATITLIVGVGLTPPAAWVSKASKSSDKPEILAGVQATLADAGFKSSYFNSGSVTQAQGVVVSDPMVQCGLQFMLEDGDLVARVLLGGGKSTSLVIDTPAQALRITQNATRIFDLAS
jgi:hypothetical protein